MPITHIQQLIINCVIEFLVLHISIAFTAIQYFIDSVGLELLLLLCPITHSQHLFFGGI